MKNNLDTSGKAMLVGADIKAGFPSPADDFADIPLDLNKEFVHNPSSTFFVRVDGDSMSGAGIDHGDLLIVDKSLQPVSGDIAICFLDGEFNVKKLEISKTGISLIPANPRYNAIKIESDSDFSIWGVVRHVIKTIR